MSLSERLREVARGIYHPSLWDDLSEAATTIDTQAAEIERLRASLARPEPSEAVVEALKRVTESANHFSAIVIARAAIAAYEGEGPTP